MVERICFIIYTKLTNGKIYIGVHKTEEHKKNISNAIKEWHRKRKENAAMA